MRRLLLAALAASLWLPAGSLAAATPRTAPRPAARSNRSAEDAFALARDTLAWVGDRGITALDLVQRIEWMPWPEKSSGASMDSVKLRALRSLAAEALLARESERRSPAGEPGLSRQRDALRRALARDALYRDLGRATTPPSAAEITALVHRMHPGAGTSANAAWRRVAADSLRTLAGQRRAAEFMVAHLAGKSVTVDSAAFMMLADTLRAYMLVVGDAPVQGGGIIVPTEAPDMLLARLAPALGRPLARLPDGPLTLGDAIEDMRFYLWVVQSLRPGRFAADLSSQLRLLVEGEMMAREALRRGLGDREEVRHDLRTWTDTWRAQSVLGPVLAGGNASDDEAFRVFATREPQRALENCEVDLEEILCGSADEAGDVRAALGAGARFDSLARRHSRRPEWAELGGRSGFFPAARHAELGFSALLSPLDSLLGPLQLPEGWTLYRVRGKRLAADSVAVREAFENARIVATGERRSELAARYVASLAGDVPIRFAAPALARVDILRSNMVVRRTLGFGGGMTAAPSLLPLWGWTRYWRGTPPPLP